MKKLLLFFLAYTLSVFAIYAQADDPRSPLFPKTQPDGKPLAVRMYGGSHADFVFYTTRDSIALVLDDINGYCYARPENGHLVSTGIAAHEPTDRDAVEQAVAASTVRLFDALSSLKSRATRRRMPQANYLASVSADGIGTYGRTLGGAVNSIGEYTLPVVLVQFPDREFASTSTNEQFDRWLNAEDFSDNGAAGSVRQYFTDQSKGMFIPNFEVVARITLDSSYVYYGKDNGDSHDVNLLNIFLPQVFAKLKSLGVSLTKYQDSRTNNSVPLVAILYAGTGQASSGMANDIWPCEMDLGTQYTSFLSGYRVNSVFFGNEITYGKMTGLGVFCHEFGHALGLPDIYNTTYSHSTPLTDYWSIMQSGCYVSNGYRPIDYLAIEKNQLGWLNLTEPTEPHVYTLYPMSSEREPHALLLRNPANNAEYYIVENRQPGRWSGEDFGAGLLVTHVDYNATAWQQNNVNNDANHPRFVIVPADNHLSSDASDLFPTSSNRTLTDKSTPATKVYTGTGLGHPLYAIKTQKDGTITFSYGSASAPAYFVGDTVDVTTYKLHCVISGTRELTVIASEDGYTGAINIPNDSVYFDHTRYWVVGIAEGAFANCPDLTSVHVGNRVRSIAPGAFANSPKLQAITVSEDNSTYESIDGALYTRLPNEAALQPVSAELDFAGNPQHFPVSTSLRDYEANPLPSSFTQNGLTISFTDGETPAFLWESTAGIRLRIAKGATFTIDAPSGYTINRLRFVANSLNVTPNTGSLASREWNGEAQSVTFTTTAATTLSSVTATITRNADDRHLVSTPHTAIDTFLVAPLTSVIDAYALAGSQYTHVVIPADVKLIEAYALSVPTLTHLYAEAEEPATCGEGVFELVPDACVLHVAQGAAQSYREAPQWERFFPNIEEDLFTAIRSLLIDPITGEPYIYDLQGRRVTPTAHGIYIQQGRKIIK